MNLNTYPDLTQTMNELQKRGFKRTFVLENQHLICWQTQKSYKAAETQIVEFHRFSSDTKHPESSVIFAIECDDGEQGYVVSSEKNMISMRLLEFMDKVKIKPRERSTAYQQSEIQPT